MIEKCNWSRRLLFALAGCAAAPAAAQPSDLDARVTHAMEFTSRKLDAKVLNTEIKFHWIGQGEQFWYKKELAGGDDAFMLVETASGTQRPLFDAGAMSASLVAAGAPLTGAAPRIYDASVADDGRTITIDVLKATATCRWPQLYDRCEMPVEHYACDLPVTKCALVPAEFGADVLASPDRRYAVSAQDHNLWLNDLRGGAARRLTNDGLEGYAYGEAHDQIETFAASRRRVGLADPLLGVKWSPDGSTILALRYDVRPFPERLVLTEYLPPEGGPPIVHSKREAAADDAVYPAAELSLISVADGSVRKIAIDPHLFEDNANRYFRADRLWWDLPHGKVYFIGARRGGQEMQLIEVDLHAATARAVVTEKSSMPIMLNPGSGAPNVEILPKSRRLIWYSERDGWGHLYLYDLATGRLVRQLTKGAWVVTDLARVDEDARSVVFAASGMQPGESPYDRHLYRVSLDGGTPQMLTPEKGNHNFGADGAGSVAPNGGAFIDDVSTVSQPNQYILHRSDGQVVAQVAAADASALESTGWKAPEPFSAKAADGRTDLYGVVYKPRNFDPAKKYPVIEITYPAYASKYAPNTFRGTFYGSAVMNAYAFAEMGAIVVSMDGRGTSYRSAEFRNHYQGKDDTTGTEDHVAGLRNLAATRPYMDLARVGVTGHSSGGDSSLRAAMLYPDFFKVVVSGEGPTNYLTLPMDVAIERPLGVPDTPARRAYYERIATRNMVDRLTPENRVLVIYDGADEQVPLQQGFEIFRAFQSAGFVYDTLIVPEAGHWGGRSPYGVMRTARYFAEHLGGPQ